MPYVNTLLCVKRSVCGEKKLDFVFFRTLTEREKVDCTAAVVCRKQKIKMNFLFISNF